MHLNHHRAGSGEPLVLIHGIGSRWQIWEPVLPLLMPHREVTALDLPGFGDSPMPSPAPPAGVGSLTDLVAAFLRDELAVERPHVAGNSLGGWVSLELAKRGEARSATGLSPAGFHNRAEALFQRASLWSTIRTSRAIADRAQRLLASPRARKLALAQYYAHPERISPADAAAQVRAAAHAPWFDEMLVAINKEHFSGGERIAVPVTIAWGERDRLLLPRQAARAAQAIPAARIVTLRGCGHIPTYDDPQQVAQVLLDGSAGS